MNLNELLNSNNCKTKKMEILNSELLFKFENISCSDKNKEIKITE